MKLTKKHKELIRSNYPKKSVKDISNETGLTTGQVKKFIKKAGLNGNKPSQNSANNPAARNNPSIKEIIFGNLDYLLLILVAAIVVYFNSLWGEFVSDDIPGIVEDTTIHSLRSAFATKDLIKLHIGIIYSIFKAQPIPFHLASLFLHLINIILAFIFTNKVFNSKIAFIATLLFALHPVNTETIAWISGFNYLYVNIFMLAVLTLYFNYVKSKNHKYLILAGAVFLLSLWTRRPFILTIPLALIPLDLFIFSKSFDIKKHLPRMGFIVFLLIVSVLMFVLFFSGRATNRVEMYSLDADAGVVEYITRSNFSTYMLVKLLVFPLNLSLYQVPNPIGPSMLIFMSLVTLTLIGVLVYTLFKNKTIAALIMAIVASVGPVYSPIQVSWFMAERYLYFASLMFGIILALTFIKLEKHFNIKNLAIYLTVILAVLYSIKVVDRNVDWQTPKNLWTSAVKVTPYSHRGHNNLGDIYSNENNLPAALEQFAIAIKIKPDFAEAYHNLGVTYMRMGQIEKAEEALQASIQLSPGLQQGYYKLAVINLEQKEYAQALEFAKTAVQLNPQDQTAKQLIARIQTQMNSSAQ